MPIKKGFRAACLLNCILLARAQTAKDQEDSLDLSWFLRYMFLVHVFAVIGLMAVMKRFVRPRRNKAMCIQTEFDGEDAAHPKLERKGKSTEQVYVVGKGSKYHSRWCQFVQKPPARSRVFLMSKGQCYRRWLGTV